MGMQTGGFWDRVWGIEPDTAEVIINLVSSSIDRETLVSSWLPWTSSEKIAGF